MRLPAITPPPARWTSGARTSAASAYSWDDAIIEVWAETSTNWPSPDRFRSASAISAAPAASPAACRCAWGGALMRSGARSASPVMTCWQLAAFTVRSEAGHVAFGPSAPKGVIATCTSAGLSAARASRSRP